MSPVVKNATDMSLSSQILDSAVATAGTTGIPDRLDDEHTATGIPISLLWMPYVGFSLVLILLMLVSFLHYHRKHGHKYHHRQQFWGNEMSVSSVLGNISHQVTNIGKRAGRNNDNTSENRFKFGRDSSRRDNNKDAPRSKGIGYRGVEEYVPPVPPNPPQNLPPNGGLHINRSSRPDVVDSSGKSFNRSTSLQPQHEGGGSHRMLPSQPTTAHPLSNPHRPGHRPRPRNAHCDEPSTSSSTVSSKTSNQSAKPGGGRNRPAHNRRHKRPLVFEANENGSMVDIRVSLKDDCKTIEIKPAHKERGQPMHNNNSYPQQESSIEGTMAQKHNPSYRYSNVDTAETEPLYRNMDHGDNRRKLPSNNYTWVPSSDTNTYPSNPSIRAKYRDINPDEYSIYEDRTSRSTSLPIWSTMPLRPKPPAPRRDFYSYPFTPSGHMEMLSDTENDEVFLLQHTKL